MHCNAHGNTEMNKDKPDSQIKTCCLLNVTLGYKSALLLHFPSPKELVSFVKPRVASFNTELLLYSALHTWLFLDLPPQPWCSFSAHAFLFFFWYDGFCSGYLKCLCCSCTCRWSIEASPKWLKSEIRCGCFRQYWPKWRKDNHRSIPHCWLSV